MKKNFFLEILLLLFLGFLSSISLPPFNFFFINFFTFSILFIFLFKKLNNEFNKKIFFFYGWLFGFGYFLSSLYWITISLTFNQNFKFLIPAALILIPSFLALFYGLITYIFYLFKLKKVISAFLLFSLLFGLTEFIRGNILTGFPWNLIVFSLSENLSFLSFISVIGTYSLNLIVISFFSAPAIYILRKSKKEIIICILILSLPIIFYLYNSFYKIKFEKKENIENTYVIRVIGSNINLDRFDENSETDYIIKELINLSSPDKNKKIFFLWPEGIIPNIYQNEISIFKDLFKQNFNENHLIGLGITNKIINGNDVKYFNTFSVFDNNLDLVDDYNKVNLVPFGEFLPFENFFEKIGLKIISNNFGSFTKGENRKIIEIKNNFLNFKFLPLICYEIIYSGNLTNNFDFNFILNISEDGWFGKSIGPKQHFAHSIFRAIENGKYVIRSANNGMAAIINPLGKIENKIDYGKAGFIDFEKRKDLDPTFFSIYGNKIFGLIILLYIFSILSFNRIENE